MAEDTTVQVILVLGHDARVRTETTKDGFTHDWCCWVRGDKHPDIHHFVEKVVFHLHESFPKPRRVVKQPPYEIRECGFGSFDMLVDVYFRNKDEPRMVRYTYDLCLPERGQPPIHAPRREMLTFSNPPSEFSKRLLQSGATLKCGSLPANAAAASTPAPAAVSSLKTAKSEGAGQKRKPPKSGGDSGRAPPAKKKAKEESKEVAVAGKRMPTLASSSIKGKGSKGEQQGKISDGSSKGKPAAQTGSAPSGRLNPINALLEELGSESGSDSGSDLDIRVRKKAAVSAKKPTPSPAKVKSASAVKEKNGGAASVKSAVKSKDAAVKMTKKVKVKSAGETTKEKESGTVKKTTAVATPPPHTKGILKGRIPKKTASAPLEKRVEEEKPAEVPAPVLKPSAAEQGQMGSSSSGSSSGSSSESSSSSSSRSSTPAREEPPPLATQTQPQSQAIEIDRLQLFQQLSTLENPRSLQKIVDLVEPTGKFHINKETFDFDLTQIDEPTLLRLQSVVTTKKTLKA
eukprot:m.898 g.898  ORF g.898 m.898 type:complete len:516 (+) comp5106_c0_seq1:62-1609(+)